MDVLQVSASLISLVAVHLVTASLFETESLQSRQVIACNDTAATFDSSCWATLDLSNYLNAPGTGWNTTVAICKATESDSGCCGPEEPWTTCFIRLATNGADQDDCSAVATGNCDSKPVIAVPINQAQVRYVVHNIYYINAFFSNWYQALTPATVSALLADQSVVNEVDPPQQTNFLLNALFTALTAAFAFVGAPEVGGILSVGAQAVVAGIQQAPGVLKTIWPEGTEDSKSAQLGNLETALSQLITKLSTAIQTALALIMSDMPTFINFASPGAFSGPDKLSLPQDADVFGLAFRTYLISTAMARNGWKALPICNITRADLQDSSPGGKGISTTGCTYDDYGVCSNDDHTINAFYSDASTCAYALTVWGAGPNPKDLMADIVSFRWSTLEALFDGALKCTVEGKQGMDVTPDLVAGGADLSCMSQLVIHSCSAICPLPEINGVCPIPCDAPGG